MATSLSPLGPDSFAGQTVLVTGAAGGIGRSVAALLGALGARLVLCDAVPEARTADVNRGVPGVHSIHQLDVSSRQATQAMARAVGAIDVLTDTAGICPRDDWMDEDWDATFDRVINVNVRGPINLARAFMPGMVERKYGRIVLCGSLAGWTGGLRASAHYAAAKGGVHALVRWLAVRATPHGVCVNGVAPGPVASAMTDGQGYVPADYPMNRLGSPEEIAALIAFLSSRSCGYMAGSVVDVNGGVHLR